MRILIIDDEPMLAATLQRLLSRRGHEASVATSGLSGLQAILEHEPDFILCDLGLPDLPGLDLLERLAVERPALVARLVFMSGGDPSSRESAAIALHRLNVLEKPFAPTDLLALIEKRG